MRNPLKWLSERFSPHTNAPDVAPIVYAKDEPAPQVRRFIAFGNYGWNFGTLAKRLKGRHKERWQQGRYNRFVRTQRPPRFWTADDWQERCAAMRRAGL